MPWAIGRETNERVGLSGGSCLYSSVVSAVTGAYGGGVEVGNLADPRWQEAIEAGTDHALVLAGLVVGS